MPLPFTNLKPLIVLYSDTTALYKKTTSDKSETLDEVSNYSEAAIYIQGITNLLTNERIA